MTVIKTKGVRSSAHVVSLKRYLDDERALVRGSQNITDASRAFEEMADTRKAYGTDRPAREGCANETMLHQVIAFLPEDADINGGKMTPDRCMRFAEEWLERNYPDLEAYYALHREKASDGTERYAVHIALNRTMLDGTGRRLDEGPARVAKARRAQAMREMDKRWGLKQLRANERNSALHARSPTRAEREMRSRDEQPIKDEIRKCVKARVDEIRNASPTGNRMRELARRLSRDKVSMTLSKDGKQLQFRRGGLTVNGDALGRGFSPAGIAKGLGMEEGRRNERDREQEMDR